MTRTATVDALDVVGEPERALSKTQTQDMIFRLDALRYGVRGELSFVTAASILKAVLAMLREAEGTVVIDLAEVERADSAGVALLIEWVRVAKQRNVDLRFANLSQQLKTLVVVSGVDSLLPRLS